MLGSNPPLGALANDAGRISRLDPAAEELAPAGANGPCCCGCEAFLSGTDGPLPPRVASTAAPLGRDWRAAALKAPAGSVAENSAPSVTVPPSGVNLQLFVCAQRRGRREGGAGEVKRQGER